MDFKKEITEWIADLDPRDTTEEIQKSTLERVLELYEYYNPKSNVLQIDLGI